MRFKQKNGAIGSCCAFCGKAIREHYGGPVLSYCFPDDVPQSEQMQQAEEFQQQYEQYEQAEQEKFDQQELEQQNLYHASGIPGPRDKVAQVKLPYGFDFTPPDFSRIEVVEQAIEVASLLPEDSAARQLLLNHAAIVLTHALTIRGVIAGEA